MSSGDPKLTRLLLAIADDLEQRYHYPAVGAIRRGAQVVATRVAATPPAGCPVCGGVVEQPATGAPKLYCSAACKLAAKAARRRRSWNCPESPEWVS